MKKIPTKNYIILSLILIVSIVCVLYVNYLLVSSKQENDNSEFIKEIKVVEIDNYIIENPNFIIYISSESNRNDDFEKKFKQFLADNGLEKDFVYINLDDFDEKSYKSFINKYSNNNVSCAYTTSIIIIDNQNIKDILYDETEGLNIKNVQYFLKNNEVY